MTGDPTFRVDRTPSGPNRAVSAWAWSRTASRAMLASVQAAAGVATAATPLWAARTRRGSNGSNPVIAKVVARWVAMGRPMAPRPMTATCGLFSGMVTCLFLWGVCFAPAELQGGGGGGAGAHGAPPGGAGRGGGRV